MRDTGVNGCTPWPGTPLTQLQHLPKLTLADTENPTTSEGPIDVRKLEGDRTQAQWFLRRMTSTPQNHFRLGLDTSEPYFRNTHRSSLILLPIVVGLSVKRPHQLHSQSSDHS